VSAFHGLLMVHVAGGGLALLSGLVPMLAQKGGQLHRRAGAIYASAMAVTALSAFALAFVLQNVRFMGLAVLTSFTLFSGLRAVRSRRNRTQSKADDIACIVAGFFGAWLVWHGIVSRDAVSFFFGGGGAVLAWRQWCRLHNPPTDWLRTHLTSMGASYAATMTAFLAVNVTFLPTTAVFIVPALVSMPLLRLTASRYRRMAPRPSG
jgi:uncharacterized membrane protein